MFYKSGTLNTFFMFVLISCCYSQENSNDDWLKRYLEEFKIILKNGDEEMGIPKLDPYVLNNVFTINNQPKINVTVHIEGIISNFSDFTINFANLEKNLSSSFLLTFMHPTFEGRFSIDGTAMTVIPMDSKGILKIGFNRCAILVESLIVAQNQSIQLNDFSFAYTLQDLEVTVEGLLADFGLKYVLRDLIANAVFPLLSKYQHGIQNAIRTTILTIGNDKLKQLGLRTLIEMAKEKYI